mmetsp:Transcript_34718/g.68524  ORF Transcript_34718/g.68524 Transcript_34718/m.68524 type:complete len:89 (-) Transcript_34718:123-389(-)
MHHQWTVPTLRCIHGSWCHPRTKAVQASCLVVLVGLSQLLLLAPACVLFFAIAAADVLLYMLMPRTARPMRKMLVLCICTLPLWSLMS